MSSPALKFRNYAPADEEAAIELWRRTWQLAYPNIDFAARVAGDEVSFGSANYREWLHGATGPAADHAVRLIARFNP